MIDTGRRSSLVFLDPRIEDDAQQYGMPVEHWLIWPTEQFLRSFGARTTSPLENSSRGASASSAARGSESDAGADQGPAPGSDSGRGPGMASGRASGAASGMESAKGTASAEASRTRRARKLMVSCRRGTPGQRKAMGRGRMDETRAKLSLGLSSEAGEHYLTLCTDAGCVRDRSGAARHVAFGCSIS